MGVTHERSTLRLPPRSSASLNSYFAAFPAALWMRIAGADRVTLSGEVTGSASVRVSVRSASGVKVSSLKVEDSAFEHETPLSHGDEWVWAEIVTTDRDAVVRELGWELNEAEVGLAAVCITTHNRPADCLKVLESLATDDTLEYLDRVIVVDQGSTRLRDAAGFSDVAASLGERLRLIEQANLGGSGGFSRGMLEAASAGADYAIVLDDDVRLEPESVRRVIALAARSENPVIVGAHMLDLAHPTRLHSWGEQVERSTFEWAPVAPDLCDVDLTVQDVTEMPADAEVQFNGWWMCLIPTSAVRMLGAALPFFIKWDDTEFSLRAAAAGFTTVTMPGAALWHVAWTGKDDGLDWQAYFQLRNRLVTALLHSDIRRRGSILRATFALDVNHVLCMQYGSAAARRLALSDVLIGPESLEDTLATRIGELTDLLARANQVVVAADELPRPATTSAPPRPHGLLSSAGRLLRVAAHQIRRPGRSTPLGVDTHLTRAEGKWWALGLLDSATVESATGKGAFVSRRSRRSAISLLRDAVILRVRLWWAWPALSRAYRADAPRLASADAWSQRFDMSGRHRPHGQGEGDWRSPSPI